MAGVCLRWAVVYSHDKMPIDGCLYVHKTKAITRMKGMANQEKFEVARVAVMPEAVALRMADALSKATLAVNANVA